MSERDSICAAKEKPLPQMVAGTEHSRLVNRKSRKSSTVRWATFTCHCGVEFVASVSSVRSGHKRSCGCLRAMTRLLNRTHGMSGTAIYKLWAGMKKRCEDSRYKHYHNYGGRGIRVCERWQTFENFYADMGDRPSDRHSLDRIDNNGHYEPENCRWATATEQNRNRRNSRFITANGVTKTMTEWAEELGCDRRLIHVRLSKGWSDQEAIDGKRAVQRMQPRSPNGKFAALSLGITLTEPAEL